MEQRNSNAEKTGVLIVGHGSPRPDANAGFVALVDRIAGRLNEAVVRPAFFSITTPDIGEQVKALYAEGLRRVVLMPYFLFKGQHAMKDIPTLVDACRKQWPDLTLELLPTLENEPALEDLVVERLTPFCGGGAALPTSGAAIEARSQAIIARRLARVALDDAHRAVTARVIHATADFSFAETLRFHPAAIERGLAALRAQRPILCDVRMLQAGLTRLDNEILCAIGDADVEAAARDKASSRAACAMEKLKPRLADAIVAVGNAPTALWQIMALARDGGPRPALVIGVPVGFVGARESKQALLESDLCYITNVGARGGSPVAAAIVNALAILAGKKTCACAGKNV